MNKEPKKIYTLEDVKKMTTLIERVELPSEVVDNFGNVHNIQKDIEQAEKDIAKLKSNINVNFRWNEFEVRRAKEIARKLGIPYQSYIKMTLKQAMDLDEQKYN